MTEGRPAAVVAGASGLVGGHLLEELRRARGADGEAAYREVVVLTRRPLGLGGSGTQATGATGSGGEGPHHGPAVRELVVDFDALADPEAHDLLVPLREALAAAHLYCALGTTIRKAGSREAFRRVDHDYPLALGRIAKASGATFFGLVSSVGADPGARSFYLRVKGEVEDGLRGLGLPSLALLRPSVIGGERRESRPLETVSKWVLSLVPGRYRTVHARSIAGAMVSLALDAAPGWRVVESEEIRRIGGD